MGLDEVRSAKFAPSLVSSATERSLTYVRRQLRLNTRLRAWDTLDTSNIEFTVRNITKGIYLTRHTDLEGSSEQQCSVSS